MLKQTVQYTDFDGVNKTKVLYFNLTRIEVIDNLDLQKEFLDVQDMIGSEPRDLEQFEIRLIMNLIKKLMKMSYGVQRSTAEGDLKFTKNDPSIWDDFIETAVYDEFLIGLFEDAPKARAFLTGIWPKEIQAGMEDVELPGMPVKDYADVAVPADRIPQGSQEPTREALLAMTKEDFDEIAGSDPTKMSPMMLQVAFQRRASGN